jgi:hypothetical protein
MAFPRLDDGASPHPSGPGAESGRAKPAFAWIRGLIQNWRMASERRVLRRFAGRRWCDSTEREVNDALSDLGGRSYFIEQKKRALAALAADWRRR